MDMSPTEEIHMIDINGLCHDIELVKHMPVLKPFKKHSNTIGICQGPLV